MDIIPQLESHDSSGTSKMTKISSYKVPSKYIQIKHILDANNLSDDFFIIINNSF
jgi:hypothetical protein